MFLCILKTDPELLNRCSYEEVVVKTAWLPWHRSWWEDDPVTLLTLCLQQEHDHVTVCLQHEYDSVTVPTLCLQHEQVPLTVSKKNAIL